MPVGEGANITIQEAVTGPEIDVIRTLFLEYAETLNFSLRFQGFDEELAALPGKYSAPKGSLLLASNTGGEIAGCVAIRPINRTDAEMKRLYVRPAFRGLALGRRLAEASIAFARSAGYQALCLDTIAETMAAAESLYLDMGFVKTAPYYENPVVGATFYRIDIKG
jgi:putative acetyltransferase